MESLKFILVGVPKPKQSARFSARGGFIRSYQTKAVKQMEEAIHLQVAQQMPKDFEIFDCPIGIRVLFVFPPLKGFSKSKYKKMLDDVLWKHTKPDLTDNLMKGLADAIEGLIYTNDSRICKVESSKIYGENPRTEVEIYKL